MKMIKIVTNLAPGDMIYDRGELVTVHRIEKDTVCVTVYHSRGMFTCWDLTAQLLVIEDVEVIELKGEL